METRSPGVAGETGLLVGLDIGGTKTAVLVVDRAQNVVGRGVAPTNVSSPDELVDGIYEAVIATLEAAQRQVIEIRAIGAGVPGMVNSQTGDVFLALNLNLHEYPLGEALSLRFGVPVALDNDVRVATLGAFRWLNSQLPAQHMAYLSIGTGISSGVMLNGRLYRGAHGMAGEIGHVIHYPDGVRCVCGLRGCLEAVASGPALSRLWRGVEGPAQVVFAAAERGDAAAQQVINQTANGIARAIHLLVMAYDVERVVLGGGVMHAGDIFLHPIHAAVEELREQSGLAERMLPPDLIIAAPPDADVARWGAVILALQALETER